MLITILGWLAVVGGARPHAGAATQVAASARRMLANPPTPNIGAAICLVIGALLVLLRLSSLTTAASTGSLKTMNKPISAADLVTPKVTTGPLAGSRKVYSQPEAAPDLRVPLREIVLSEAAGEPPLPVYDTTGAYTDTTP